MECLAPPGVCVHKVNQQLAHSLSLAPSLPCKSKQNTGDLRAPPLPLEGQHGSFAPNHLSPEVPGPEPKSPCCQSQGDTFHPTSHSLRPLAGTWGRPKGRCPVCWPPRRQGPPVSAP